MALRPYSIYSHSEFRGVTEEGLKSTEIDIVTKCTWIHGKVVALRPYSIYSHSEFRGVTEEGLKSTEIDIVT